MDLAGAVAAQDHRFLAHARDKVVPRVLDLALMPDEEPYPREEPLQLLLIDLVVDKDLAADLPGLHVHEPRPVTLFPRGRHAPSSRVIRGFRRCPARKSSLRCRR